MLDSWWLAVEPAAEAAHATVSIMCFYEYEYVHV